ncbi:DUF4959 domain-containing protein [Proteiniphilum sp.]|uniref:DUF4959 domain-containing protein n=1 Tax=Proteiniphilum sp. TaxID=1926877 RepID=UPI002B209A18|nr:DUF4959 domain-containing protein [Proteiniphilum sp.]MEA4916086.1 DUF4959 domain-containing protein [Proteiniphilum sp.]
MKHIINNFRNLLLLAVMLKILFACQESTSLVYYDENAPAPVSIDVNSVTVENSPGKSILKYVVPLDENLLYVKAVYESSPDVIREAHSSRFVDTLALEGFAKEGNYDVKLYTVGKNKKESNPVTITVSPHIPPIVEVFPSLNMIATFGGVEGSFRNDNKATLKAVLMADTANTGEPVFLQSFVIDNPNAIFTIRDLESKPIKFYVYLMDRWGNKSPTKEYELTPLFEERLDKSLWKEHKLLSDFQNTLENNYWGYVFAGIFNNYICPVNGWNGNFIPEVRPLPSLFTIDLGVTAKISRFNFVPWWTWVYTLYPRRFEVYGTASLNPGDDLTGDEWKLLGEFNSYKPSGEDPGVITGEDNSFIWPNGENFDVKASERQPDPYFPVRIIRFKILQNWNNGDQYSIDELSIWGEIVK